MLIPWSSPANDLQPYHFEQTIHGFVLSLSTNRLSAICPKCHQVSHRKHSSYFRTLQDLPSVNQAVTIQLRTQKWFCNTLSCSQRIFCERFDRLRRSARRTIRAEELLRKFAFSMNCLTASKVSIAAELSASHDTLRRLIYQTELPKLNLSTVIGIDDFAWRKGHTYGTVICDFIENRIVALLPDRRSETVSNWLRQHPHVKIVSRDGSLAFKEAIDQALPGAIQISDRWHIIKNAKKRLEQILTAILPMSVQKKTPDSILARPSTKLEQEQFTRQVRKRELVRNIQKAHAQGMNFKQLAEQFQLDQRTAKKYVVASDESIRSPRGKKTHPYLKEITEWEASKLTVREIHAKLVELGFTSAYGKTKNTVATIRKRKRENHPLTDVAQCKRSQIINYLWKLETQLTTEQKGWLSYTFENYPRLKEIHAIVQTFRLAIASLDFQRFKGWVNQQKQNKQQPFYHYAIRLHRDWAAVTNAFYYRYSNGYVEGQVNRLKTEKRLLYGRANIALLEKRLTYHW